MTPRRRRLLRVLGLGLALLVGLLFAVSFLLDGPLRRSIEKAMNEKLEGYTVTIGRAHLSIFGLSVTLQNLQVAQQANPDPKVAVIPKLVASTSWRELLRLRLVADFVLESPRINVDRRQLAKESEDATPVKERGWQEALQAAYPLKINVFRVVDGDLTYIDEDPERPLRVTRLQFTASNIRNIHSKEASYPSPIEARGVLFETGSGTLKGHADFLADPFPAYRTEFALTDVPLDRFRSMVARWNLAIKGGVFSTHGEVEAAGNKQRLHVKELHVRGIVADYVHSAATAAREKARGEDVKKAARAVAAEEETDLRVDRLLITESEIGFVNKATKPPYRVFVNDVALTITNLSNRFQSGVAKAHVRAKFLGSGATDVAATFRPSAKGPDFDMKIAIGPTNMRSMNDLLRAYGSFDVVAGKFSFFSELEIKNGRIDGYVKPLFEDMDVYDARQDKEKNIFRKAYEGLVGGIAALLENRDRDQVATQTRIQGPVGDPETSTWEILVRLIQNAFFRSILPGLDHAPAAKKKP